MASYTTLIKPCGGACNYRCKHCFYKPISECDSTMSLANVDILLARLAALAEGDELNIVFQGGEPTLAGLAYYKYFTTAAERLSHIKVNYSLQTNGSLLSQEWIPLLRKYDFLVGLSLDGDRSINNRYRLRADMSGSYDEITCAATLLTKNKVAYNILTVITHDVANNPQRVLSHFIRKGYRFFQFTMPIGYENNTDFLPTSQEMYRFLEGCFIEYSNRLFTPDAISVRYYDNLISLLASGKTEQCGLCGKCSPYLVVDSNLDCYPCDFYATSEYKLGSLNDNTVAELVSGAAFNDFCKSGATPPDACYGCELLDICGGGCKRYRGLDTSVHNAEHYHCDAFRAFFAKYGTVLEQLATHARELSTY